MADTLTPSELTEQMFASVGRAITQWSFVEAELATLFTVCVGSGVPRDRGIQLLDHWVPSQVFHSVESFNTKRTLVDAALAARVSGEIPNGDLLMVEWAKLSDKARKLSHKRNKLAHWFVLPAQRTGTGAAHEPIAAPRLMPPFKSPKYYRETGLNPEGIALKPIHIGHIEKAFRLYADKVRAFTRKLVNEEALRDRFSELALYQLKWDDRLDPLLLAEVRRVLASRE